MRVFLLIAAMLAGPAAAQQAAPSAGPRQASAGPALPGIDRPRPQQAQEGVGRGAPVNGVLVLYGNERCPTDADGDEIVICERRSAEEQFRVPKELRNFEVTPQNQSWATRVPEVMVAGDSGTGACTASGAGGATGCMNQRDQAWRAAKRARQAQERQAP